MTFPEKLLELRRAKGMSQEDLAARVGVSRQAVSKWEIGEAMPDLNKLLALSGALEVSLDTLCGREKLSADGINATAAVRKGWGVWQTLCGILGVLLFLSLLQIIKLERAERTDVPVPISVEISECAFYSADGHSLRYRIISETIDMSCTYQLLITPETPVAGAPDPTAVDSSSGILQGEVHFPLTASKWTVSLRAEGKAGVQIIPLAVQLRYDYDGVLRWNNVLE